MKKTIIALVAIIAIAGAIYYTTTQQPTATTEPTVEPAETVETVVEPEATPEPTPEVTPEPEIDILEAMETIVAEGLENGLDQEAIVEVMYTFVIDNNIADQQLIATIETLESLSQYISQSTLDNLINTDTYTDSVDTLTLCNLLSDYLLPSTDTTGDNNVNNDNISSPTVTADQAAAPVAAQTDNSSAADQAADTVVDLAVADQTETVTTPSTSGTSSSNNPFEELGTISTITSEQLQAQEDNAQPSGNNVTFN